MSRVAIAFSVGFITWIVMERTGHPETALAVIALWSFILVLFRAQSLLLCLYSDGDLSALSFLPVTEPTIFQWELQKFIRRSMMSLVDLVCGFGALALFLEFSPAKWVLLVVIVALAWMTLLGLAMLCAVHFPAFPYHVASSVATVVAFVFFFGRKYFGGAALGALDHAAPYLNAVLPTGWPVSLFQLLLPQAPLLSLALLAPTLAVIWTIKYSLGRLRANYEFNEVVELEAPDLVPNAEDEASALTPGEQPFHQGITAIEDIVTSRQFLSAREWRYRGLLERLLWGWLTERERRLAEFVFPSGFSATASWKGIARNLLIMVGATWVAAMFFPIAKFWVLGIGLFFVAIQMSGRLFDTGSAFQRVACGGLNIPMYAVFPFGYRESGRLLMKCCALQMPLALALTVAGAGLTAYATKLSVTMAALLGCKLAILLFAARWLGLAFSFSSGTNDTSGFRPLMLAVIATAGLWSILFVVVAAGALTATTQTVAWSFCGLAVLVGYSFFRIYGWFYHKNRFDLMSIPREQ